jgi:hypothetical protein
MTTSSSSSVESDLMLLTMHVGVHHFFRVTPTSAAIEKAIVETVTLHWNKGLHSSKQELGGKVAELTLNGTPFGASGAGIFGFDRMPDGTQFFFRLFKELLAIGFRVQTSIDVSMHDSANDGILFRRTAPVAIADQTLFGLHIVGPDFLVAHGASTEMLTVVEESIGKHWRQGLQSKQTMADSSMRFKLKGNYMMCHGEQESEARLFIVMLNDDLLKRGYECIASLDLARACRANGFMLFQRVQEQQQTPK